MLGLPLRGIVKEGWAFEHDMFADEENLTRATHRNRCIAGERWERSPQGVRKVGYKMAIYTHRGESQGQKHSL